MGELKQFESNINVNIKEFKHWNSVSVIKGYIEKPVVDVRSGKVFRQCLR